MPQLASLGAAAAEEGKGSARRPNIIMILADDMGFSDIGCYGSEVATPNLDRLAESGLRFTQFYNNPRCCPSRASLLTGLYPHQVGFGLMADDYGKYPYPAYRGDLSDRCVTLAEALHSGGYQTGMCGKWHMTPPEIESKHNWPLQRGFQKYFGTIVGACSYYDPATLVEGNERIRAGEKFYYTDALGDHAVQFIDEFTAAKDGSPFFLYTAFTAPHWPLQAPEEDIAKYKDKFSGGWDSMRKARHQRQIEMGIVEEKWPLTERDPRVPPWELASYKEWEQRRMEVYAAQIDRLDQNIGKILKKLKDAGIEENTLILFMSDNGGNLEEMQLPGPLGQSAIFMPHETHDGRLVHGGNNPKIMPGGDDTYQSIGIPWANVANTPFRMYKHYTQEGGISTPLIAHWPATIKPGPKSLTHQVGHETDIMATFLDAAGISYPTTFQGHEIQPTVGKSLLPIFQGKEREERTIFWEHEGNSAVRIGKWKLVSKYPEYWALYDMEADRTELHDLSEEHPEIVRDMAAKYVEWAKHCGVMPWPLPGMNLPAPGVMPYLRRDDLS
ncbi:MAG TPA: arylsulfatase [Acidobacteriaceae bacterium]|nr:arylsulfatase [Acidobacteriaceae bacterium]